MGQSSRFPLAVHLLVALSFRPDDFISSDALSGTVCTNPVVVRRIIAGLRRAGFVVSQPGMSGGVRLAKRPSEISLFEVYRAVAPGELFRMHKPNRLCPIGKRIPDALSAFLPRAERAFERSLGEVTIEDVARKVWPEFYAAE